MLLTGLALRAVDNDPTGPWASSATLLGCAVLAGCLAVWLCLQRYVVASGVFLALAVTVFGLGHGQKGPVAVVLLNVMALAATAFVWAPLEAWLRGRTPWDLRQGVPSPFAHVAVLVALFALTILAGGASWGLGVHVLAWPAVVAVMLALVACLWDADARFPLIGAYGLALAAFTLDLPGVAGEPLWVRSAELAAFVSAVTLPTRTTGWWARLQEWLAVPPRRDGWPTAWFGPTQTAAGAMVALMSLWLCFTEDFRPHPLTGPLVPWPCCCRRRGCSSARIA